MVWSLVMGHKCDPLSGVWRGNENTLIYHFVRPSVSLFVCYSRCRLISTKYLLSCGFTRW